LGVTHWSARLLGAELGISFATVARIWRKWNLQPWRRETFKFSTDPELDAKIRDVVGLYLQPPEKAVVVCIDEKSQIQALDRTAPTLPIRLGIPERQTHDYVRHGTTTLFAALEVATGRVEQLCQPRHRHQEFLRFLKQVAKAYPRVKLHVVCDNYATHTHPAVCAWLTRNPRITLRFTPTAGSWLNMVEILTPTRPSRKRTVNQLPVRDTGGRCRASCRSDVDAGEAHPARSASGRTPWRSYRTGPGTVSIPSISLVNGMNSWFITARGSKPGSAMTPWTRRRCMPKLPAS